MIEVLNLGAGVQSSTVLLMSLEGELPPIDHAIFADTGWEPAAVYLQMDWLEEKATAAGVKVWRVSAGNIRDDILATKRAGGRTRLNKEQSKAAKLRGAPDDKGRWASMPYFTMSASGQKGVVQRQCTNIYKIKPIERFIRREVLGLKARQRAPKEVVMRRWYGISFDEMQRMRISQEAWAENWYPLVERRMTRGSCHEWLRSHGYPDAPRSACIGCPYRRDSQWREIKRFMPIQWSQAVEIDWVIRDMGGDGVAFYLHKSCKPLNEANLWRDQDENQLPLFDMVDECSGMCGV